MKPEEVVTQSSNVRPINMDYMHGAAIVDSEGNEILITEEMILQACEALESELN